MNVCGHKIGIDGFDFMRLEEAELECKLCLSPLRNRIISETQVLWSHKCELHGWDLEITSSTITILGRFMFQIRQSVL